MRYLIPVASHDDLFPRKEFHFPKPLIEIDGEPMIARVVANIREADPEARFIFVVREEDCREFGLDMSLQIACGEHCRIVRLIGATMGASCSALMAVEHIDDNDPLVICNGDQILGDGIARALASFRRVGTAAGVITFPSVHPRWSYVLTDGGHRVLEAAEKRVISRNAIAGFYYFETGSSFVQAAQLSILHGRSVQGRYYISLILNEIILGGGDVLSCDIAARDYHSLFSPQRLESYERELQAKRLQGERSEMAALTVVIPMAGLGSRFVTAGYGEPKPFIDIAGATMIERVIDNLAVPGANYILIARAEHLAAHQDLVAQIEARGNVRFVSIDKVTEGAACTVLMARPLWNADGPLLIANCDQIIDFDCAAYVRDAAERGLDGSILVFQDAVRDPKWSFARTEGDRVVEVQEKKPISDLATVGLYLFRKASIFNDAALDMIVRNERANGEFYVCPVYNHAIALGYSIGVFEVEASAMHGIGTPSDLDVYLSLRYPA